MAWYQLAEAQVEITNTKSKECGKSVSMLKLACSKFEECKDFVAQLGGQYAVNYNKVYGEACALRDQMIKENKTVYYESEMALDECPKPDATNYVKIIDISETLK